MKRSRLFAFLPLLLTFHSVLGYQALQAQLEVSQWYFGWGAGLDFRCDPPEPLLAHAQLTTQESCSSISDSSGNLLFYTDGATVFDASHAIMANGSGIGNDYLCQGSSTQGALIVKQPGADSLYYIFTVDCAELYLMGGMNYSVVNMNRHGGLGEVVLKMQRLLPKATEKLAATLHANGTDVWIVAHEWGNDRFVAYELTAAGLDTTPVSSYTGRVAAPPQPNDPECAAMGALKFSPQGDRLVAFHTSACHLFVAYPEILSFDRSTGQVSYLYSIDTGNQVPYYAGSFSPNGNVLYASEGPTGGNAYQFNLLAGTPAQIAASKYTVYYRQTYLAGAMQIGPNGKIYVASGNQALDVIHFPNNLGASCQYVHAGQPLARCHLASAYYGLPNNVESFYLTSFQGQTCPRQQFVDFNVMDSCAGDYIYFGADVLSNATFTMDVEWDFGDPGSGGQNVATGATVGHIYAQPGTYVVTMVASQTSFSFGRCVIDSITRTISVVNCPVGMEDGSVEAIHIYPVPARELLHIASAVPVTAVEVVDLQGRVVQQAVGDALTELPLQLSAGFYLVRLTNAQGNIAVQKLEVQGR